jgi:hypothetical protein
MAENEAFLADVDALVISDRETEGRPALPEGARPRAVEALGRLVVDRVALSDHFKELARRLHRQFRHTKPMPEEQVRAVLERGLVALDDAALAALALNPIALCDLADQIDLRLHGEADEVLSDIWMDVLVQDGRESLVQEFGRLPTVEELIEARPQAGAVELVSASFGDEGDETSTESDQPISWKVILPLCQAEWLGREDAEEHRLLEDQEVHVRFSWWSRRTPPTLEVRLSGALRLGDTQAKCSVRLVDAAGKTELETAEPYDHKNLAVRFMPIDAGRFGSLEFECEYRRAKAHLRFRVPVYPPGQA